MPTLEQATRARLSEIRDIARSGITELTGRAIREGGSGAFVGRIGGLKPMYPELFTIPDSPKQIAEGIDRGQGRVFDRVYRTVEHAMQREGFQPRRARAPGRATVPPHEGKAYCHLCRQYHAKGQHRSHGAGSFHRTHLWGFSLAKNPEKRSMKVAAARRMFAELMAKARQRALSQQEKAQLRTASQIIRYEKRRSFTGAVNRPRKKRGLKTFLYEVIFRSPDAPRQIAHAGIKARTKKEAADTLRRRSPGAVIQSVTKIRKPFGVSGRRNPRLSRRKARLVLHHGEIGGFPLTAKQRRFFGARASGYPRRPARNRKRGLIRMGKLVELRYERDHGNKPGYYKHTFRTAPTLYYDAARNMILAR